MSRTFPEVQRRSGVSSSSSIVPIPEANGSSSRFLRPLRAGWNFWFARVFLAVCANGLCSQLGAIALDALSGSGHGLVMAVEIHLSDRRLRRAAGGTSLG